MRTRLLGVLLAAIAGDLAAAAEFDATADVAASPPRAVAVSIYRAPYRNAGTLDLNALGGFALVSETRTVRLPAGTSRLRFEGVVGGIRAESAIVTGLPGGVIEKNRDAAVLSPAALLQAAVNADVTLARTDRKTGKTSRVSATIRSASPEGVVFETVAGVEALRCSGMPETFAFSRVPAGLSSVPTLSVTTHAARAVTATVTLSYLADGFDWSADYTAKVAPDGRTLDLSAWITLANGNGESLNQAATQIIAGRLNRVDGRADPVEVPVVLARCWPQGTTSDTVEHPDIAMVSPFANAMLKSQEIVVTAMRRMAPSMMAPAPPPPAPTPPPPEQLGDLKLYRVPYPTTVASRQAKQTRLLDQHGVAFERVYIADLDTNNSGSTTAARSVLRFTNTVANHLGLPLPSGHVALFQTAGARTGYAGGADLRDTAEGETFDLDIGAAPDVQVEQTWLSFKADPRSDLTPDIAAAWTTGTTLERVAVTNAGSRPVDFELRLRTYGTARVIASTLPVGMKDGRPIFRITLPANGSVSLDYLVK